jgi:Sec-independent protein translocase protein TatA
LPLFKKLSRVRIGIFQQVFYGEGARVMGSSNKPSIEELSAHVKYQDKVIQDAQKEIDGLKKEKQDTDKKLEASDKRLGRVEMAIAAATTVTASFIGVITFVILGWDKIEGLIKWLIKWAMPETKP